MLRYLGFLVSRKPTDSDEEKSLFFADDGFVCYLPTYLPTYLLFSRRVIIIKIKLAQRINMVPYLILAGDRTLGVPRDLIWTDFNPLFFLADLLIGSYQNFYLLFFPLHSSIRELCSGKK